ncbi:MAG: hypothetical protein U0R49_03330 [Fimbriimonadales bacterium]
MAETREQIVEELNRFISAEEERNGGPSAAIKPGPRLPFVWPRHSVSAQYNVKFSQFTRTIRLEMHGEAFEVAVADTAFGVFGRCDSLKAEAKGSSESQMLKNLKTELEPYFERQFAISRVLNRSRRFEKSLQELPATDLIKLLYCPDRDVASCAMTVIDSTVRSGIYAPALMRVLRDESHPNRRIAQWCALDILEDLHNVCLTDEERLEMLASIEYFMMNSPDDYARAVYKAGDVLGDHVATDDAKRVLLNVLSMGPNAVGRRSAIHGLIHLCEWIPSAVEEAKAALARAAQSDPEPLLREYASATIEDIESGEPHGPEPSLPSEAA